jgi:hypothetical protein
MMSSSIRNEGDIQMNTPFPRIEKKNYLFVTITILLVIIVVNFGLSWHPMNVNDLSLYSSTGQAASNNPASQPAVSVPVPVPTTLAVVNQPIATPLPPQSAQPTPQFSPVPTPPPAPVH